MNRIKNSLVALGGVSLLIGVIALVTPRPTQGQGGDAVGPTKPVKVVNAANEPVPVTGTVTVGNLGEERQPFQESLAGSLDEFTVPTDKRLVIEYVSGQASNATACRLVRVIVETTVQGRTLDHSFIPTQTATSSGGVPLYVISQETSLSADPGTSVRLSRSVTGESPCGPFVAVTISGYLVDVP